MTWACNFEEFDNISVPLNKFAISVGLPTGGKFRGRAIGQLELLPPLLKGG